MFFKDFVSVKRQKIKRGASQTYDTPPFWLFFDKNFAFSLVFYKKWLCSIWIILCCICRLEVSPFCRRTAFFCLEDSVKMSSTRESTLGWNDVVAIIWTFQHHLFCSVETYLAEPYSEVRVQACLSDDSQFAALQLLAYKDFGYKPVTDMKVYTGKSAEVFSRLFA